MIADRDKVRQFCEGRGVRLLVLFGSRASGTDRPGSDVDLALRLDDPPQTLMDRFALEDVIEKELEISNLHLVVLNTLQSTTLGREIVRTGQVLYDRDGRHWVDWSCRAMKEYMDFEPYRRRRDRVLRGEPIGELYEVDAQAEVWGCADTKPFP